MLPMQHPGRDAVVLSALPEKLKKYDLVLYRRDDGQIGQTFVGGKKT